ncbi:MAG: hypothetical protein LH660_15830 [Phormidesmis sp. CAN_BIN36]|nr:hypothetical protein [Phormidesmis sp. CAN_BIN36]
MKNSHFLVIILALGWMSGCTSIQSSQLRDSPALSDLQATTAPTPASIPTSATTSPVPISPLTAPPQANNSESEDAVAIVQRYYNAIDRRDYEQAYQTWQGNGSASHQTFEAFKNGFAETASTQVKIGEPSQVEGAAGSQYITVPVALTATAQNQAIQHFKGTYVLRRSLVDGTSTDQRSWHIYSAKLVQTE